MLNNPCYHPDSENHFSALIDAFFNGKATVAFSESTAPELNINAAPSLGCFQPVATLLFSREISIFLRSFIAFGKILTY